MARALGDQDLRSIAAGRPESAERTPFGETLEISTTDRTNCPITGFTTSARAVITDLVITCDAGAARHVDVYEGASSSKRHRFSIERWGQIPWPMRTSWVLPKGTTPEFHVSDLGGGEKVQINIRGYID